MHIVYKAADDLQLDELAFRAMLNPGALYENIDGEAIEWAERRLLARPESHRLLLVISDGAPVDDATLLHSGPSILWRHIRQVIERIETDNAVHLGAIGINYRVSGFYRNSVAAEVLAELPHNENELRSWLRKSDFGQVEIKCRHIPVQAETLRRSLPLPGKQPGVVIVAKVAGKSRTICARRCVKV